MIEHIAEALAKNMFTDGLIRENEKSIYLYSIQLILEKLIVFSVIYIIAIFQGCFLETVLFVLCFSKLRKYTGGFHVSSFRGCFIGTVGIYLVYTELVFPYLRNDMRLNMVAVFVAGIVVFVLGALNHPDMDWDRKEYEENKTLARTVVFVELLVIVALTYLGIAEKYILFMSFGMILCAILLTLGKLTGQEVKCDE